tara:strand:- start:52 stop:495 length:444 start_codon:yes stop_codon:yes gene_type:complete
MKSIILLIIITGLASCSSIDVKRTAPLSFETRFIGKVEERRNITLEPNESKAGRVLVGLISAGPIGALATANTEEGFSDPTAYEYKLSLISDENETVVSRSIVETGNCVEVISPDESDIELLIIISAKRCEVSYNNTLNLTPKSSAN